jgi:hypothetical protein
VAQLWAEAWTLYVSGAVRFWEVEGAGAAAEEFVVASPLKELVESGLALLATQGKAEKFQSMMLYGAMGLDSSRVNGAQAKEIANVLRSMGFGQKKIKISGLPIRHWIQE